MLNSHSKYMIKMRKLGIPPDASSGLPPPRSRGRTAPSERTPRRRPGRWTSWRSNWSDIFLRHHSHHAVCPKCKESKGSVSPHQWYCCTLVPTLSVYLFVVFLIARTLLCSPYTCMYYISFIECQKYVCFFYYLTLKYHASF